MLRFDDMEVLGLVGRVKSSGLPRPFRTPGAARAQAHLHGQNLTLPEQNLCRFALKKGVPLAQLQLFGYVLRESKVLSQENGREALAMGTGWGCSKKGQKQ